MTTISGETSAQYSVVPVQSNSNYKIALDGKVGNTLIVDSLEDIIDANDGVTTLREAINTANNQSGQGVTVFNLAPGSVINLTGQLDITNDLIVNGPGAGNVTISGNNSFSNFFINNANVVLSGLTIANGLDGINVGSGSTLVVTNSIISNNANDGIDVNGNDNVVNLINSTVIGNGENGLEIDGERNTITVSNSSFTNNEDGFNIDEGSNNSVTLSNSYL